MSRISSQRWTWIAGWLLVLAAISGSALQWTGASEARQAASAHRPIAVQDEGYVSSDSCRSCHPSQYASWSASYHRSMTQVASPASVVGNFSNPKLGDASHYLLQRDGDRFIFGRDDDAGALQRFPITLVTGSHHMQIYWYETGDTRKLGQVPFVYLTADQRWVPRAAVFLEPPKPLRRPDESGRWNHSCSVCHTTRPQARVSEQGQFDTHVAEFGIACEACHGPGQAHVAKNTSPLARYREHFAETKDHGIVQPKRLDHRRASEICSQCHSLWQDNDAQAMQQANNAGAPYRPGQDAYATRWLMQPSQQDKDPRIANVVKNVPSYVAGQFWSDGMARVSGREFSGMIDSPCYLPGKMSCLSCHTMHKAADDPRPTSAWADDQLGAGMTGDHACVQCHKSLSSAQQQSTHTKHAPASEGSRCYNCHMPNTSYGLLKAMRSHRISVPSASETVTTGRPNACNLCHLDKSLGWTATQLHERYGTALPELTNDQRELEFAVWLGSIGDAGQRALVAGALGWAPAQRASDHGFMPALLGVLMDDPYDAVRFMAERSLRSLPGLDLSTLQYDFVTRPNTRAEVSGHVATLAQPPLPAARAERLQASFRRLLPKRDHRPVVLLE